ncbi:molybdopterin-binding protein [Lachnospiraceae bacterium 62-35]
MKLIRTEDAVGHVLCHDITQIIKGVTKDAVFRKGHVVRPEDIPVLLSVGKENLYIWEKDDSMLHENEAAEILCGLCKNENMAVSEVKEGKIELTALCDGLFKLNRKALIAVNSFGRMMIASRHGDTPVKKGDKLAGTRVIPLVIEKTAMEQVEKRVEEICGKEPIFKLLPFFKKRVGVITTGNEVLSGRIADTFTPVIEEKLREYNGVIAEQELCGDDSERITREILRMAEQGMDMIICTGGMSVDPDDRTPLAIRNTGAEIISYGAPVLPGAMFLMAYLKTEKRRVPVMGLPGCVMYAERTIFDIILPRIMAENTITKEELAELGEGGLCLSCPRCMYPDCGFGKGR